MEAKKELVYDELPAGREFKPFVFPITRDFVSESIDIIGDRNPLYYDDEVAAKSPYGSIIAPHSIAGIYARSSYLGDEYIMPPGGVLTKLDFEFFNPAKLGDVLTCNAKVIRREIKDGKRHITIEIRAKNQEGMSVSTVRIFALWQK